MKKPYTEYNRQRQKDITRWNANIKISKGCQICGYIRCPDALVWHHLNPDKKTGNIQKINSWPKLMREITKCLVVCHNCHTEIHAGLHPEYLMDTDKEEIEKAQASFF